MSHRVDSAHLVELEIWEPSGVHRHQWPLTVGVPFPKGAFAPEHHLVITHGQTIVPVYTEPTSYWDDGSIRWTLLDLQTDLRGNEKKKLAISVHADPRPLPLADAPSLPLTVSESAGTIHVHNGDLDLIFQSGVDMPLQEIRYRGRSVLNGAPRFTLRADQKPYVCAGPGTTVKLETYNPFRAVIRCDGRFVSAEGEPGLDLTVRAVVYAGRPFVKLYHTVGNYSGRDLWVEELGIELQPALGDRAGGEPHAYLTGPGLDDSIFEAVNGIAQLTVTTVPVPGTTYSAEQLRGHVQNKARLGEIDGTTEYRAGDHARVKLGEACRTLPGEKEMFPYAVTALVCGDGLQFALACKRFYPQAPKQLSIDHGKICLHLYDGDRPLQFWRGTCKTHELHLLIQEAEPPTTRDRVLAYKRLALALEEPPAPTFGSSNWLQHTAVAGPLFPYRPDNYPWFEFMFRSVYEKWARNSANNVLGATFFDYGDYWNPSRGGQWQNNEMDYGYALLIYLLRTGHPAPFPAVESMIHHMIDVDTHHEADDPVWVGAQRYHQVRHGALSGPTLCHEWLQGPLTYYFYTGYERAREVAFLRAEHFCRAIEAGRHRIKQLERYQGWPLIGLTAMLEHFPDERYRQACETLLDWLEQWMEEDGDFVYEYFSDLIQGEKGGSILGRGVIGQALAYYHRVTGSERAWALLVKSIDLALDKLFTPEGLGMKTSFLRRSYFAPGESDFILEALGYLWECTGETRYMEMALRNFKLAFIQRDPIKGSYAGVAGAACELMRMWPPFLYYAEKSGMLEDLTLT